MTGLDISCFIQYPEKIASNRHRIDAFYEIKSKSKDPQSSILFFFFLKFPSHDLT